MPHGQIQHVEDAENARFGGEDGAVALIEGGRGRTGQVVDLMEFLRAVVRGDHIVLDKCEARIVKKIAYVIKAPRVIVVKADHALSLFNETMAQVGSHESCAARNENVLHHRRGV